MALTLAILSTLSLAPTVGTLSAAIIDQRRRIKAGINGELAALATQSVNVESLRLIKHVLLIIGIWGYNFGWPQPWTNTSVCWLLAGTSVYSLNFRRRLEARIARKNLLKPKSK